MTLQFVVKVLIFSSLPMLMGIGDPCAAKVPYIVGLGANTTTCQDKDDRCTVTCKCDSVYLNSTTIRCVARAKAGKGPACSDKIYGKCYQSDFSTVWQCINTDCKLSAECKKP